MYLKYLFLLFTLLYFVSAVKITYEGYKLFKVIPKNDTAVKLLEDARIYGEFWDDGFVINQEAKIMVAPEKVGDFLHFTKLNAIETKELISDIKKAIDDQMKPALSRFSQSYLSYSWTQYHNLQEMYAWFDELERNHPGVVTTVTMGRTFLENEIRGVVINYNPGKVNPLIGVLEGALHAREWISPATVTWIIKEFLTSTDPEVRALAENIEWHIFPVVNPDGYRYTFTNNRMWRKNRNPAGFTSCAVGVDNDMSNGIDLNRNFGFQWNTVGASDDPCSNLYAGTGPFSERESQAIRDYVLGLNNRGNIIYYIAFHSYTQLIIVPYSHVTTVEDRESLPDNFEDLLEIATRSGEAIRTRFGTNYRVGLSEDVMYAMSGTSFDWAKSAANISVAYLIELRDLGEFGFLLPPSQIIPTALETMDGLLEMDRSTRAKGYYSSGTRLLYSMFVVLLGVFVALLR